MVLLFLSCFWLATTIDQWKEEDGVTLVSQRAMPMERLDK